MDPLAHKFLKIRTFQIHIDWRYFLSKIILYYTVSLLYCYIAMYIYCIYTIGYPALMHAVYYYNSVVIDTIIKHICTLYKSMIRLTTEDEWPPEQPKHFTAVVLIHHKNKRSKRELIALIEAAKTSNIIQANQKPIITLKDISEIFLSLSTSSEDIPFTILIEGVPGIGKTFLSKYIAYHWASGALPILQKMVLLLFLRDPTVQKICDLEGLIKYFYCNDKISEDNAKVCARYLQKTDGIELTIILDGYDELPEQLKQRGFLAEIIQRKRLPACNLIVTSRLSASAHLHGNFDRRIEILGFSNEARFDYICKTLKDAAEQKILQSYLEKHPIINSYCYIPLNMTILLHLFKKMKQLPSNQTELYNNFICLTICHFLRKSRINLAMNLLHINNLPEYYKNIILNLGKLSLQGINGNKLIFSMSDIKEVFPDIDESSNLIHGFGLLQAVQHFGMTQTELSFNFIHASVQEFLAAFQISALPYNEELMLLKEKFWVKSYQNTWMMYVGITHGQKKAFKQFLAGEISVSSGIASSFLEDPIKCIHMFQCFKEVSDHIQCSVIDNAKIFENNTLDLHGVTLLPRDMEAVSVFLAHSKKQQWDKLDFLLCNMGDTGCNILQSALCNTMTLTLNELNLADNHLSTSSSKFITDITLNKGITALYLQGNHLQDGDYLQILAQSGTLEELDISENEIQMDGAVRIFKALKYSCLKKLILTNNGITKGAADEIGLGLTTNNTLEVLGLSHNKLQSTGVVGIMYSLNKDNKTLKILDVECNDITDSASGSIAATLANNTSLEDLNLSGNSLKTKGAIKILSALETNCTLRTLSMIDCDIAYTEQAGDYITNALACNSGLEKLLLCKNRLQTSGAIKIMQSLQKNSTLKVINLWNNNITDQVANEVAITLENNTCLEELVLQKNEISSEGVKVILSGLKCNRSLKLLAIPHLPLEQWISLKQDIANVTQARKSLFGVNLIVH